MTSEPAAPSGALSAASFVSPAAVVSSPFQALGRHGATSKGDRRLVIVGDVHGCFEELSRLLAEVALAPDDLLISVGDLIDRGPEPSEVIRFFRERPNTLVLMGNHERKHVRAVFSYAQEISRLQLGAAYGEIVEWMTTLPYYYEDERVCVVHAGLVPGVPLGEQRLEVLAGTTSGERELERAVPEGRWHERYAEAKPVAFGHHVVGREPLMRGDGKIFGLDTGACHGWALTALCVPGFTVASVPARRDHWAVAKVAWQLPVLQARPWLSTPWGELAEELARFASSTSEEARIWLAALGAYVEELRCQIPVLRDASQTLATQLLEAHGADGFAAAAQALPAAALLFQARRGRLDAGTMERLCTSPQKLLDFAAQLGVTLPRPPMAARTV